MLQNATILRKTSGPLCRTVERPCCGPISNVANCLRRGTGGAAGHTSSPKPRAAVESLCLACLNRAGLESTSAPLPAEGRDPDLGRAPAVSRLGLGFQMQDCSTVEWGNEIDSRARARDRRAGLSMMVTGVEPLYQVSPTRQGQRDRAAPWLVHQVFGARSSQAVIGGRKIALRRHRGQVDLIRVSPRVSLVAMSPRLDRKSLPKIGAIPSPPCSMLIRLWPRR